ncbi:MAG TPA: hypothetical protein VEC19_03120 [Usitatibacter sp.]|nr:hypothetical protein [Usitatibacter sp.]
MFKAYLAAAFLSFGLFGYSQYKGWSILPSEAQEWADRRTYGSSTGGSRSGSGGHK